MYNHIARSHEGANKKKVMDRITNGSASNEAGIGEPGDRVLKKYCFLCVMCNFSTGRECRHYEQPITTYPIEITTETSNILGDENSPQLAGNPQPQPPVRSPLGPTPPPNRLFQTPINKRNTTNPSPVILLAVGRDTPLSMALILTKPGPTRNHSPVGFCHAITSLCLLRIETTMKRNCTRGSNFLGRTFPAAFAASPPRRSLT